MEDAIFHSFTEHSLSSLHATYPQDSLSDQSVCLNDETTLNWTSDVQGP